MINRREALLGITAVAIGSALPRNAAFGLFLDQPALEQGAPEGRSDAAVDERLRRELAVMSKRANSEAGVPVLLACVDLAPLKGTNKPPVPQLSPWNKTVTAQFKQTVAAWERVNPKPQEGDVGKVIQVLATRNFGSSGGERQSR